MTGDLIDKLWLGLTRNVAFTAPAAQDERLRGRTFAIPFEDVWQASLTLVDGGLRRWRLLEFDDREGIIRGIANGRLKRFTSAVTIRVSLDVDAQTRVDGLSASRSGRMDLGVNARRLDRFFRALDAAMAEATSRRRAPRQQATSA